MSTSSTEDQATYAVERHSIDYVSSAERHGRVRDQGPFWFTVNFQFMSVSLGFVGPAMGLSLGWTTLAAALGIVVGTIFMAFHASQGPIMGLPQMVQSRAQFGYRGVILPLTATLVNFIGFNVICALLIMGGLHDLFGWDRNAVLIGLAISSALLAFYGYDWMHLVVNTVLDELAAVHDFERSDCDGSDSAWSRPSPALQRVRVWRRVCNLRELQPAAGGLRLRLLEYLKRDTPTAQIVGYVFIGAISSAIWLIALGAAAMNAPGTRGSYDSCHPGR